MADKLLPCPFCGGEGKYHGSYFEDDVCEYVSCTRCNASTPLMYKKGESIEWWNRRANPWHTGTPTEEGLYIVYNKHLCYDIVEVKPWTVLHDIVAYMPFNAYVKLGEKNNG